MSDKGTFGWKGTGSRALEFPAGDGVAVAPPGRARFRYNRSTGFMELSLNGAPYVAVTSGTGVSPWEESAPGLVTLVNVTDTVALGPIGAVAGSGSSSLILVGITSAGIREFTIRLEAEALTDDAALTISAPGAANPMFSLLDNPATGSRIAFEVRTLNRLGEGLALHNAIAGPYTIDPEVEPLFLRFTTSDATQRDVNLPAFEAGLGYWIQCDAASPGSINVTNGILSQILAPGQRCYFASATAAWATWGPF